MAAFQESISIDGSSPYSSNKDHDGPTKADYQAVTPKGRLWSLLKAKHSSYDVRALDVRKQELLFRGGFQMNNPDISILFCPRMRNEEDDSVYKDRVSSAAYTPTFSKLITGLTATLFSQDLAVMEATDHDDETTPGEEF